MEPPKLEGLSLENYLRFFYSAVIAFFYLIIWVLLEEGKCINTFDYFESHILEFIILFLALGPLGYLVYKNFWYDPLMRGIQDGWRLLTSSKNYRIVIKDRFKLKRIYYAVLVWGQIKGELLKNRYSETMLIHLSLIHLSYMASFFSLIFLTFELVRKGHYYSLLALIFALFVLCFSYRVSELSEVFKKNKELINEIIRDFYVLCIILLPIGFLFAFFFIEMEFKESTFIFSSLFLIFLAVGSLADRFFEDMELGFLYSLHKFEIERFRKIAEKLEANLKGTLWQRNGSGGEEGKKGKS